MKSHRKWGLCALIGRGLLVLDVALVGNSDAAQATVEDAPWRACGSVTFCRVDDPTYGKMIRAADPTFRDILRASYSLRL